jgi:uncharacterized protein (TIGR01244 family)
MVTKQNRFLALAMALPFLVNACTTPQLRVDVSPAQSISDWPGLPKLSRSGDIYFGGQPTREAVEAAPQRGVKTVINLRSDKEVGALGYDEPALVRQLGMKYVAIPVTPSTFGIDQADRLKEVLTQISGPVLIHCASSNRVGAVWALYLNRHRGVPLDEAIELGRKAGMSSDMLVELIRKNAK